MKFSASTDIATVKPEDAPRYTDIAFQQVASILNNGLEFGDNFNAKTVSVTFSTANVDTACIHGLGRVPSGYIVVGTTAAMAVYDGASANSSSLLYLRASAVGTARLLVY